MIGRISTLALVAGLAFGAPAMAAPTAAQVAAAAKAVQPKVVAWRRDIHEHPELGNQEVRTSALIASSRGRSDCMRAMPCMPQVTICWTRAVSRQMTKARRSSSCFREAGTLGRLAQVCR